MLAVLRPNAALFKALRPLAAAAAQSSQARFFSDASAVRALFPDFL
jgi:hypothetical protein